MTEKLRTSNGDESRPSVDNSQYVHEVVENSAQSAKIFLALAQPVQARIITDMTEILAPVEAKNRKRWYLNRAEIGVWKLQTLDAINEAAGYSEEEEGETEEAILLRELAEIISKESGIRLPHSLNLIKIIFKRSMATMESGFQTHEEAEIHRKKSKNTGELRPGDVNSTGGVSNTGSTTFLRQQFHETARRIF